jgi:hypothetical protein
LMSAIAQRPPFLADDSSVTSQLSLPPLGMVNRV